MRPRMCLGGLVVASALMLGPQRSSVGTTWIDCDITGASRAEQCPYAFAETCTPLTEDLCYQCKPNAQIGIGAETSTVWNEHGGYLKVFEDGIPNDIVFCGDYFTGPRDAFGNCGPCNTYFGQACGRPVYCQLAP